MQESAFVAGGIHRGQALAHLDVDASGQLVSSGEGVLGPRFDAFIESLPRDVVIEAVTIFHRGVDVCGAVSPEYLASVRPPGKAGISRRSRPLRERNSGKVVGFEDVVRAGIAKQARKASMEVLGRVADVVERGCVPAEMVKVTIDQGTGRVCLFAKAVNLATRDRPAHLEGTIVMRQIVGMFRQYMAMRDDKSGYLNLLFREGSSDLFGLLIDGWVLVKRGLEFGWKGSCGTYQR